MIRTWLLFAVVATAAQGATHEIDGLGNFRVEGWSQDGLYFVWTLYDGGEVLEARTGRITEVADLESWKKKHPMAKSAASRLGPDGKSKADVKILRSTASGSTGWTKNSWSPDAHQVVELRVSRDGKSALSLNWPSAAFSAEPYWSPDGLRIAWLVVISDRVEMDGTRHYQLGLGAGTGPRMHLVADKGILAEAGPKVAGALEKAGFGALFIGSAKKARDASVVYAAAGFEDTAAKIAAAIPGGATVDKLSWPTEADVVVGIGRSAIKGVK
jgi:hypothetical protein